MSDIDREPVRLALVGYGWFAQLLHTRVFSEMEGLRVVGVVDPNPDQQSAARHSGLVAHATLNELLDSTSVDAIAVLTPHDTHRELVLTAAARGVHVFCEKAFAVTADDCVTMMEACHDAGVVLVVGHMQKLFPTHRRAIELVRTGVYGPVRGIQVDGFHWGPVFPGWWRTTQRCGGLLYWTGIHDLDTIRALVGSEVSEVYAMVAPSFDDYTDYEGVVGVTLRFDNGAVATLSVAEQWPLDTFEEAFTIKVLCAGGGLSIEPGRGQLRHAERRDKEAGMQHVERFGTFSDLEEAAYSAEFAEFVHCVQSGVTAHTSAQDGLRCVEALEAITASIKTRVAVTVSHREVAGWDTPFASGPESDPHSARR